MKDVSKSLCVCNVLQNFVTSVNSCIVPMTQKKSGIRIVSAKDIQDNDVPEGLPECVDDSAQQTVANLVSNTCFATTSKMTLAFVAIFPVTRDTDTFHTPSTDKLFLHAKPRECATETLFMMKTINRGRKRFFDPPGFPKIRG